MNAAELIEPQTIILVITSLANEIRSIWPRINSILEREFTVNKLKEEDAKTELVIAIFALYISCLNDERILYQSHYLLGHSTIQQIQRYMNKMNKLENCYLLGLTPEETVALEVLKRLRQCGCIVKTDYFKDSIKRNTVKNMAQCISFLIN